MPLQAQVDFVHNMFSLLVLFYMIILLQEVPNEVLQVGNSLRTLDLTNNKLGNQIFLVAVCYIQFSMVRSQVQNDFFTNLQCQYLFFFHLLVLSYQSTCRQIFVVSLSSIIHISISWRGIVSISPAYLVKYIYLEQNCYS